MDWLDFTISSAFSAVLMAMRDSKKKKKFKEAFLKIYRNIKLAFPEETAKIDAENV